MPLITEHQKSLPYIDPPPSPRSLTAASDLITAELPAFSKTTLHPLVPPAPDPQFTPLMTDLLDQHAAKQPLNGIDLSRYEGNTNDSSSNKSITTQTTDLKAAYTNSTYLSLRHQALELLEQFGKNAWLVGNAQLEDVLRGLERELVEVREGVEETNRQRKGEQEGGKAELEGLEAEWRRAVRGCLEVGVGMREVEEAIRRSLREGARAG